jgi:hypothetical protein
VLPATDFESALLRPSRKTFEAAVAAAAEVSFSGDDAWARALAEAVFEALPVLLDFRFAEAFDAISSLVTFLFILN